ncbi:STAGA complex 65 subunit gamma-like isoform X3 [Limulus polyphemus]|uniref:STAGA complex 65 subunit gamma-like isoform X3 n=1 Tax=Limulus polyphemus TaxID=6850 RepID=A0ABM1S3F5_LIMPO|nr:STAGA complex 65 subunit gamma-like isoform X3 [Limulus polyphemus]
MIGMFQPRWGDLPMILDTDSGIAAIEREQITKRRPVEVEGATLYQPPPSGGEALAKLVPAEHCSIDSLTLHTIKLLQYAKKLRSLLHTLQQQQDSSKTTDTDNAQTHPPPPPVPEYPESQDRQPGDIRGKNPDSDFVRGKGKPPPELSFHVIRQILRKAVAAVFAHVGFDTTSELVLETLVDIVHDHYLRVCRLMRVARDREALTGNTAFVDVIEQVFHEIGLGSMTELHNFYQHRVVAYHRGMMKTCQQLMHDYEKLRRPEVKPTEDSKLTKIKEEPVSEIEFPVMEEVEETTTTETAEPPLQLEELQTMEPDPSSCLKGEDNIKWPPGQSGKKESVEISSVNLDPEDEVINVSDSPAASAGEPDVSQSIPSISDTMSPSMDNIRVGKPPPKKKVLVVSDTMLLTGSDFFTTA